MNVDKNILSIDSDDDNLDYKSFSKHLNEHTDRNKNAIANDFIAFGDILLTEIEEKNIKKNIKK